MSDAVSNRGRRTAAAFLLVLAGCATSPEQCDPRKVSNLFTSASCNLSGGFPEHVRQARLELEMMRRRQIEELGRSEAAKAESLKAARSRDDLAKLYGKVQRDIDRLRLEVAARRGQSHAQRVRNQALQDELGVAEARLRELQNAMPTRPEDLHREVRKLEEDVQARLRATEALNRAPPPD